MRRGIALPDPASFVFPSHDPEFSSLTASILGEEITDNDGWDQALAELTALFDGAGDLLDSMLSHIGEADFVDGAIDSGLLAPVGHAAASLISDGQPLFDDVQSSVNPPTPPPPPTGGGGGGGGGGGQDCGHVDCTKDPNNPCCPILFD